MLIRAIRSNEIPLLTDFLYEAIFQEDTGNLAPSTIIQQPDIWKYIDRFGELSGDYCLVAEEDGNIVGAVWVRNISAFGFVGENIPEFAISIYPEYRNQGIGTQLMESMLLLLKKEGYENASLAVQKKNYASKMYLKIGFEIFDENDQEYIMIYRLNK